MHRRPLRGWARFFPAIVGLTSLAFCSCSAQRSTLAPAPSSPNDLLAGTNPSTAMDLPASKIRTPLPRCAKRHCPTRPPRASMRGTPKKAMQTGTIRTPATPSPAIRNRTRSQPRRDFLPSAPRHATFHYRRRSIPAFHRCPIPARPAFPHRPHQYELRPGCELLSALRRFRHSSPDPAPEGILAIRNTIDPYNFATIDSSPPSLSRTTRIRPMVPVSPASPATSASPTARPPWASSSAPSLCPPSLTRTPTITACPTPPIPGALCTPLRR